MLIIIKMSGKKYNPMVGVTGCRFHTRTPTDFKMQNKWNTADLKICEGFQNFQGCRTKFDQAMQKKWNTAGIKSCEGFRTLAFDNPSNYFSYYINYVPTRASTK